QDTMAQVALTSPGDRHQALRNTMTELFSMDEPRQSIAAMMSGLGIHYDLGPGHPLLGRRIPDLDIATADGPLRVYELLHPAKPDRFIRAVPQPPALPTAVWINLPATEVANIQ